MQTESVNTWMPIYWGDYLRDTAHLSAAEHGAYLLLIGHYWTSGIAIPDDDDKLRRIARMERPEWKKARATLAAFFKVQDGYWYHGRIELELIGWQAKKDRNKQRASTAASKRWGCSKDAKSNATSMPEALLATCPSPSPSPKDPPKAPLPSNEAQEAADAIWRMAGMDSTKIRVAGKIDDIRLVSDLMEAGYTPAAIEEAAREVIVRTPSIKSLWGLMRAALPEELAKSHPPEPAVASTIDPWPGRMGMVAAGSWPISFGPKPGYGGCSAPKSIRDAYYDAHPGEAERDAVAC